jgi:hypothetical protein
MDKPVFNADPKNAIPLPWRLLEKGVCGMHKLSQRQYLRARVGTR